MIPEIGHFALVVALCVAIVQALVPMVGAARGNAGWMNFARPMATAQFILVAIAFFSLMFCYVTSDFSILNVVENSHTDKPLLYKIAGVWGNHEGSMLLWIFILAIYGAAVAMFGRNLPPTLRARALAVQAMISTGFILFILFTSNPFTRIFPAPANGEGLNPLLQDSGLAFHPPFLYLGYVGFSMAFSFAIAALIEGKVDAAWARYARPWVLAAWCFLTFGIAMGSWWAYYTLGWGGWWYWDPVENASFMPWLVGTALLHSIIVLEKRDTLRGWTMLLTIITFSFSLLGTFLVRSGVLTSVHSFATDPERGIFILLLLTVFTGGSFLLYAWRAPRLKPGGSFAPFSREGALLINNMLLSAAAGTVLLGTLYPLFMDIIGTDKISVGPPYFNLTFVSLIVPMVVVMASAPLLAWQRANLKNILQHLKLPGIIAIAVAVLTWVFEPNSPNTWWASATLGLAAWLCAGTVTGFLRIPAQPTRTVYGMSLAHIGMAIVITGITGSTAWKTEKIQMMRIGDTVNVAGYDVTLKNIEGGIKGPNYTIDRATFTATRNRNFVATLQPERRLYTVPPRPTTHAAIHTNFLGDLYAVVGDADGDGGYVTRLYYNPLVPWIFIGAGVMAMGGAVSLSARREKS